MPDSASFDRRKFLTSAAKTGTAIVAGASLVGADAKADEGANEDLPTNISGPTCDDAPAADISRLKTMLILDRLSVADAGGASFHLNPAKKHPENPVLLPGEPQHWDGLQVVWPGTVLYDAEDKLFRCWYSGMDPVQKNRPPLWSPGYAESSDGLHWTKPDLGQLSHNGQPTNRIAVDFSQNILSFVVKNPDQSDPQRRYLSLWTVVSEGDRLSKSLASSPDGKVWKHEGTCFTPENEDRVNFSDIYQLIFQPDAADENDRVLAYGQLFRPRGWDNHFVRQIALGRGPNPGSLKLIENPIVLGAEQGIDEEIHFASVKRIGDTFLMLFESNRFTQLPLGDLRLAVSNDGRKFRRVFPQEPLVTTGARGMWDENILVVSSSAMQEVGDEIWIYYFGCPNVFKRWPSSYAVNSEYRGSLFYPSYLGLATLPRDRFAYAKGPGSITTSTLTMGEQGLWLNVDGAHVAVIALDAAGGTIAKGVVGDSAAAGQYRRVVWADGPPSQPFQAKVVLNADERVYSVRY